MGFTKEDINREAKCAEPYDTFSFLQGFQACARLFGVWKDGQQVIGCMEIPVKEIEKAIEEYTEEQL